MAIFTRSERAGEAHAWQQRLRRALEEELFVLHFQPVLSLRERSVAHHEALVRLADERDGTLVEPASFLVHAERSGLIREIDLAVLDRALGLLARRALPERPDGAGRVAVNLSALSVSERGLLGALRAALARHRVDPAMLILELTETAAITDLRVARSFCAGALELGCAIALDDFGSGYGSFAYLKHLPFSQLKIDGEFIRHLPASRTDQLIVQALARLACEMGRETVAECVGDEPTLQLLRRFGVDYAQGYAIGRPRPLLALAA